MKLREIPSLFIAAAKEWQADDVPRLAAALAFYMLLSLAPLLVILVSLLGLIFEGDTARTYLLDQVQSLVGGQASEAVATTLENVDQPGTNALTLAIGLVVVFIGATVFQELEAALNIAWNMPQPEKRGLWSVIKDRFFSFSLILGIGFLLLVSLMISAALSAIGAYFTGLLPGASVLLQVLNFALSLAVITLLFAAMFKFLPDRPIGWRNVWLGAAVTALLFVIGKQVIGFYLGNTGVASAYGAAGSFVALLIWVYYSAQILLFGAEFTQIYARRYGGIQDDQPTGEAQAASLPPSAGTSRDRWGQALTDGRTTAQRLKLPARFPLVDGLIHVLAVGSLIVRFVRGDIRRGTYAR